MKHSNIFLLMTLALLLGSCSWQEPPFGLPPSGAVMVDTLPGAVPYLTKDDKGAVVLSWVRTLPDSSFVFCYARSTDGGVTFGSPVVVTSSTNIKPHSENLPKVIFKPSGEIIALWGAASHNPKNKYAGNVYYSQSFDKGRSWSAATPLVRDTAGYDQRYFDVALLPGGEVAIVWLDNRKTTDKEGSALYYAATSGPTGFTAERRVAENCCPCCRTDLFVDRRGGLHVIYRGILRDSVRDMVHSASVNGGHSFTDPQPISPDNWVIDGCPHTGPSMTENGQGLHFAWYTGGTRKGSFYTHSFNNGQSFAPSDSISHLGKHPQLAALGNGDLVIVWDEAVVRGQQVYTRIGVQQRSAKGIVAGKAFLTADTLRASYPVIVPVGEEVSLVAFCTERGGAKYVAYQRVTLH